MKKFITLVKRECWEHKNAFFIIPVLLPLLIVAVGLFADASCVFSEQHTNCDMSRAGNTEGVDVVSALSMLQGSTGHAAQFLEVFLFVVSVPVAFIMVFIMISYLVSCLVDERRDKSILFWNSLPVSQAQILLSKVFCGVVLIPSISLLVSIFMQVLLVAVMYIRFPGADEGLMQAWQSISVLSTIGVQVVNYSVFMLASLAFVGFLMLLSAYFSRPFIMAVVILIALLVVEAIALGSHTVRSLLLDTPFLSSSIFGYGIPENALDFTVYRPFSLLSEHGRASLTLPGIWVGACVGAGFIFAAASVRKHRSQA